MKLGVIKESEAHERRVALVPETVKKLSAKGFSITIEAGAGRAAGFSDRDYEASGAMLGSRGDALRCDAVLAVTAPRITDLATMRAGSSLFGLLSPTTTMVEATDVRPETKEQVESLGAKFLAVEGVAATAGRGGYAAEQGEEYKRKQAELIASAITRADVVITTAQIPGRRAPRLVTEAHLASMRPGSVVVDLAAESGGNVEGSEPGVDRMRHGVMIVGARSAPSAVAFHASQAFSRNLEKLLLHLAPTGTLRETLDDDIARGCVIVRRGEVIHPQVRAACPIMEVAA
jgi:NAD(P) transhydrogenase subunit alpha